MTATPMRRKADAAETFTASELQRRLSERYRLPQWAYFPEVRDAAGFNASRSADGVAFDTYKGHAIHGFEVKVSRADWLRELEQPGKCEAVGQYCDHWWVVAAPGVVRPGEIPPQWGLLLPNGDGLRMEKAAPKRADVTPVARTFVALLFRRACVASPVVEQLAAARAAGVEEGQRRAEATRDHAQRELDRLRASVKRFEDAAGVKLDEYNGAQLSEAYALVKAGTVEQRREAMQRTLRYLRDEMARHAQHATAALDSLAAPPTPSGRAAPEARP